MLTLNDGRSELWQWDTGRKLTVDADCSQVHFSNKVFGRSIDVDVADGVAIIPDILLQTDKDVTAWAFVGTAENGYTKISKVFKVNKRNKPADYVFTPQDQSTLGEILDRIEDLENRPSGDVSEEDIQNAVNEYLDNNPISVNETDPTVPDWAKRPQKPTYTAKEVGAMPAGTPIPEPYVLPTATADALGGVKPVAKGADMTQEVGVDELGGLWTAPGGGEKWERINQFTLTENALSVKINKDADGNPFKLKSMRLFMYLPQCKKEDGTDMNTGYAYYDVNGLRIIPWQNPSSNWDNSNFIFRLDAIGDYIISECLRGATNSVVNWKYFSNIVFKDTTNNGEIRSFEWRIFNANANMPSAMAGATFDVWGVRV